MFKKTGLFFLILVNFTFSTDKIYPTDESTRDNSFLKYKNELIRLIDNKDTVKLKSAIDDSVVFKSYGEECVGAKNLLSKNSNFWDELKKLLQSGCVKNFCNGDTVQCFQCPIVFFKLPEQYEYSVGVVISGNVPIYEDTVKCTKICGYLNYDVLPVYYVLSKNWVELKSYSKIKTGYFSRKYLSKPWDEKRITFEKKNNNWLITVVCEGF